MVRIIGIGGKLASGKDAIADYLVENHGWVKLGMSDALAEALYAMDPLIPIMKKRSKLALLLLRWRGIVASEDKLDYVTKYSILFDEVGYVKAKENEEVRRLLQKLGTEVGRRIISESTWTDIVTRRAKAALADGAPGVIVSGIRFPNELTMIEDLDGELWWVTRPSLSATVNAGHSSENSVSSVDFDRVIVNDGTLDDLYNKVDSII